MVTDMLRLRAILVAAAALLSLLPAPAQAQSWPSRPVKIVAPFAAGGAADRLGRIVAEHFSTAFGQQFFIENRGGAGGQVGTAAGATAEPDGYTLVVSSIAGNVISPAFHASAGYDGLRDFTHIAYLGGPPAVMIVHPSLGVTTYKEFVALARRSSEPMSYISPGTGSHGFLVAEYIAQRENYRVSHIPYKGAGPALADLVAGHVKLGTMTFSTAAPQIRGAKVIPLAVTSEARIPSFPDLPALKEVGPDLVAATNALMARLDRLPVRRLERFVSDYAPDAIVCTHMFPPAVLQRLRRQGTLRQPIYAVVTDFMVHSTWINEIVDGYFLASGPTREVLLARGLPASILHPTGIPVKLEIAEPKEMREVRARRGLPADGPIVTLFGAGIESRRARLVIERLLQTSAPGLLVVVAGRSIGLTASIADLRDGPSMRLLSLGRIDYVDDLVAAMTGD